MMRKATLGTLAAKQVCATLGVSHGTLNSWAHAGFFRQFDAAVTTPGKARRFSFNDLLRLRIQSHFLDFAISPRKAWPLALQCVDYINKFSPTEINVFFYTDAKEEILLDNEDQAPGEIALRLTIYPKTMVAELRRRLAASDDPRVAAMSRHRSAAVRAPKGAPKPGKSIAKGRFR